MLTDFQQLHHLITDSRQILLVLDINRTDDDIASALAMRVFLEKQSKQVEVASVDFKAPTRLRFLPGLEEIKPQLSGLQKFTIKVDVSKAKIETLSYEVKDNWLSIYLNPTQGTITKDDLRTAQSDYKFDLIISIGARDLESLGEIFLHNTDLFYKTPIINIDHQTSNEHFGQVNMVDTTASSNSEVIYKIIQQLGESFFEEKIASCLLTGLISQTHSFKSANVTPNTLNIAGKLMNLGADREKIIRHLYRTRSIAALKLWGEGLSRLQTDKNIGLVWTTLTREDFVRAGAIEADLQGIIAELIDTSPEAKIILILHEPKENGAKTIQGILSVDKQYNALEMLRQFNPKGNKKTASFVVENKTLKEAEETVLEAIKTANRA